MTHVLKKCPTCLGPLSRLADKSLPYSQQLFCSPCREVARKREARRIARYGTQRMSDRVENLRAKIDQLEIQYGRRAVAKGMLHEVSLTA